MTTDEDQGMLSRRVALVDVGMDAAQAFRTMLEILRGRTQGQWLLVDSAEQADVIVAGFGDCSAQSGQRRYERAPRDKALVAIVAGSEGRPHTPYVLTHPFRVMQVLSLLNEIADDSVQQQRAAAPAPTHADAWDFAMSVRALASMSARAAWYRTRTDTGAEIFLDGALQQYACDPAVAERVRSGVPVLSALAPASVQNVPLRHVRRPIAELLWSNAQHASAQLAPWLDAGATFRLRRWPDFGTIAPTRARLQIVAALSARACTRSDLVRLSGAARVEVDRVLNALSLCDLLAPPAAAAPSRPRTAAPPPGLLRSFIDGLRRTLSLGS